MLDWTQRNSKRDQTMQALSLLALEPTFSTGPIDGLEQAIPTHTPTQHQILDTVPISTRRGAQSYVDKLKAELRITEGQDHAWAAFAESLWANARRMEAANHVAEQLLPLCCQA
jgi:hypothetical protein